MSWETQWVDSVEAGALFRDAKKSLQQQPESQSSAIRLKVPECQ